MRVKFKKLNPEAKLPVYGHPGEDAGLDLFSLEDAEIKSGERKLFALGFALEFEPGFAAIVKDKGGPPMKYGLHTMGGVFDSGFRGEYNVLLINLSQETAIIKKGQKIAQLIIYPVAIAQLEEVVELDDTSSRGTGQHGSTGEF
ncbi:MAG TPA: dUTP diphosphatase [Candidatus Magasanikbacteria bacterium]|nr:dUTP diphosphatase [Candidatus Magasanikbacteria bacterium]